MRRIDYVLIAFTIPMVALTVLLWQIYRAMPQPPPPVQGAVHGCVIFGGTLPAPCISYPGWTGSQWEPPATAKLLHVLVVGGGGGGAGPFWQGDGGSGGGSGTVELANIVPDGGTIVIKVGEPGAGGSQGNEKGEDGTASLFGTIEAFGGGGGSYHAGGAFLGAAPMSDSGGGGCGGGSNQAGAPAGGGGNGGTDGSTGSDGEAGGNTGAVPNMGGPGPCPGGIGRQFPPFPFNMAAVSAGAGGLGGSSTGLDGNGCGGGGGGGAGGVVIGDALDSPAAQSVTDPPGDNPKCGNDRGLGGQGGTGYGSGGGGAGNFIASTAGGAGAPGVVYVEW
jgi:hypothetical protein